MLTIGACFLNRFPIEVGRSSSGDLVGSEKPFLAVRFEDRVRPVSAGPVGSRVVDRLVNVRRMGGTCDLGLLEAYPFLSEDGVTDWMLFPTERPHWDEVPAS